MTFIKKLTSDGSDDDLTFVNGASDVVLDSTYKEYLFIFNNIHAETNTQYFTFQGSTDTGSSYGVTTTSTVHRAFHDEGDTETGVVYETGIDLAQATGFINLSPQVGNGNDECCSGYLHLFNPSSTTFVKHFMSTVNGYHASDLSIQHFGAGYFNSTSAVDAVQFKFASGEIQGGTIGLFGVK